MQFGLNITKPYFNHLKANCADPRVWQAAEQLLADARAHESLDEGHWQYVVANKKQLPTLRQMIVVAYNGRYASTDQPLTSLDEVGAGEKITTLVALHVDRHGHELIAGTVRLVRDDLELFQFFTLPPGQVWPYQSQQLIPYEFERLAFHPVLDITKDTSKRQEILRQLIITAKDKVDLSRSWLACTMSPKVAGFVAAAGIKITPIAGATPADNEQMRFQKEHWPKYFSEIGAYEIH